jgi:hypothetical protein
MKKSLFIITLLVAFLIACDNDNIKNTGIPEIKSYRILGDDGSDGYVEKDTFFLPDLPFLEFTAYDTDLDIKEVSIDIISDEDIRFQPISVKELPNQETASQVYLQQIFFQQTGTFINWNIHFFLIDKKGNHSKVVISKPIRVIP